MADKLFDGDEMQQAQGVALDFKRVLARAIRFWYVIVFSLSSALIIAFYQTRYSERVYPVSASIIIREMQEVSGAELLYKNALSDPYRNYLNEPYIIRSYPLIERVIRKLNFNVSFFREGYFMTTQAYNYIPVTATLINEETFRPASFVFTLKDESSYTLTSSENPQPDELKPYSLGETITKNDMQLLVERIPSRSIKNYIGVPFQLKLQNPRDVAGSYIGRLSVKWAEEGAGVINLSLNATNPEKEMDFLKGLIDAYRELDLEKKNETAERTIDFIKSQLTNIRDSLRTVEYQLERFGNKGRTKDMSEEGQRLFSKAEGFEIQRAELSIRENYYKYLEEYLAKDPSTLDQVILPSSVGVTDPVLSSLLSRMVDVQLEIKLYVDPDRGKNPLVMGKIERIRELRRDVEEAVRTLKSTDKIKSDFLNNQINAIDKQISMLPASERQLISVQRNYSLLENLYVFLMQKLSEAGISKASNTSDVIPVNPPMRGGAVSPKPGQNYTMAMVIGLLLPFVVFILFELLNNKVQSKEDIDKMTSIPFIGGVGHNTSGDNLTVSARPKSGVAESFRSMRSNLNYFTGNKTNQVFMVSSSISGEGKTFTTINLATVFALSGKRTLIVGADMRRPKIFEDFKCSNDLGLSTFLSGLSDFDKVVQDTRIENLYLVSGGPAPPNPSELLLTDRFETFVKIALERYDFVIIDTPPLALVTDAFVISKFADHTIFVLRQNYSPKAFVRSIDEYYRSGKLKNMSILLNDIYKSGLGYGYGQGYAYNYGYSYGYGYYGNAAKGNGYYEE